MAGLQVRQLGQRQLADQIVDRRSQTLPDVLAPAAGQSGTEPCQPQDQPKNHDGRKHERGPITGLGHPSGDEVHNHDRRRQAGQRYRHPSNRARQKACQKPRGQQQNGQQSLQHSRTLARHSLKHQDELPRALSDGGKIAVKVSISWSGEPSRTVALALRSWLQSVIQSIDPYVSTEDIEKGASWFPHIAQQLMRLPSASFV